MFTTTFYSFKGGVGRTLALMNVAVELAKDGNNVAIIDFDLEAPGLHTFKAFHPLEKKKRGGVLEFIDQYKRSVADKKPKVPNIKDFLYAANPKRIGRFIDHLPFSQSKAQRTSDGKFLSLNQGKVWLMPAKAKDSKLSHQNIDWFKLYDEQDGYFLMEEMKARIADFTGADYLLIDSRTGLSDHSFVCTNQLADSLVIIFYPNVQNLEGLVEVVGDLRKEGAVDERKMIFAASRVPIGDDEQEILEGLNQKFADELNADSMCILHQNNSFELLNQDLFVLTKTKKTRLCEDYMGLTQEVEVRNLASKRGLLQYLVDAASDKPCWSNADDRRFMSSSLISRSRAAMTFYPNDPEINEALAIFYSSRAINLGLKDIRAFYHYLMSFLVNMPNIERNSAEETLNLFKFFADSWIDIRQLDQMTISDLCNLAYPDEQYYVDLTDLQKIINERVGKGGTHIDIQHVVSVLEFSAKAVFMSHAHIADENEDNYIELFDDHSAYVIPILFLRRNSLAGFSDEQQEMHLSFDSFEFEIFENTPLQFTQRCLERVFPGEETLRQLIYEMAKWTHQDFSLGKDYEAFKDVIDFIRKSGFSLESMKEAEKLVKEKRSPRFVIQYLYALCAIKDKVFESDYLSLFLEKQNDTHGDFGRATARAIIHKLTGNKKLYSAAIKRAHQLEGHKLMGSVEHNGKEVNKDTYFSFLSLALVPISRQVKDVEIIESLERDQLFAHLLGVPTKS